MKLFIQLILFLIFTCFLTSCSSEQDELTPLVVLVYGHSMSKLPFVIAWDQELYRKYGLDVELQMPLPEFENGKRPQPPMLARILRRLGLQDQPAPDITVTGHTPTIYNQVNRLSSPRMVSLAATDCSVRYYIVARPGVESLEEIKGTRFGINRMGTTSSFAGLRLIERMGWDRQFDISVLEPTRGVADLESGKVDVIVGGDEAFEEATRLGYPILQDTREWNDSLAGNSVLVSDGWLDDKMNREIAIKFLKASLEGLALFHTDPELAVETALRWYGYPDMEFAQGRYQRADYVARKPYPCYQGIENTMRIHDSHAMRQHSAQDFYDDTLLRELDESGFMDSLYAR